MKKNLDFEVNLLPVISVLAVCLSFLLLTTVWVNVGTFDVSQALGTQKKDNVADEKSPTLWVTYSSGDKVQVVVKNADHLSNDLILNTISGANTKSRIANFKKLVSAIKGQVPELNTALVMPAADTNYQELISVMDKIKEAKILNVGVAPL